MTDFSPHSSLLPFLQEAISEIYQLTIPLLYWGCSLYRHLGAASFSDWGLPEGRSLILPAQNVFSSSDYCFLKPEPCLPPLTSDLPTLRFDLLPQTGDLPWPELGLLDLPRSSFILKEKQRHCTILSSSCHYATLPSSPLISGHLSA